jgi:hypothetical protein
MAKARYTTEDGTGVYTTADGAEYVTDTQTGTAQLGAETEVKLGIEVFVAGKTRHGARPRMGPFEVAQIAITAIYPNGPPKDANRAEVTRRATVWLKNHPEYHAAVVNKHYRDSRGIQFDRSTIIRALKTFGR